MLHALGVYPSVARRYHDIPLILIERAETIARRLSGRNSLPATIVQLLREERASPGWLRQERPDLFLRAMCDDSPEDAPIVEDAESAASNDIDPRIHIHALLSAAMERKVFFSIEQIVLDTETIAVNLPDSLSAEGRASVDMALHTVAAQVRLRPVTSAAQVVAPPVQELLPPTLRAPMPVLAARVETERPAWIDAERWSQLHLMARTALAGSRIEDGEVVGSSPAITRTLRTHLAALVARLRTPTDSLGGAGSSRDET